VLQGKQKMSQSDLAQVKQCVNTASTKAAKCNASCKGTDAATRTQIENMTKQFTTFAKMSLNACGTINPTSGN
jgi:hypothetical protein